jgi:CRP-like cAMP-binding protein
MKFAAHDRGTARTLIRSTNPSPPPALRATSPSLTLPQPAGENRPYQGESPLESLPSRISAAERQVSSEVRVVDLGRVSKQRARRAAAQVQEETPPGGDGPRPPLGGDSPWRVEVAQRAGGGEPVRGRWREAPEAAPRPLTPEWPRRIADSSFAESIRPSRVASFTYLRGQRIFGPNEGHSVIYIVRAGCVRLTKTLPNGRSISLGLYGPDTVFTQDEREHGLVTGVSAEALVDTVISSLERSSLRALLAESPDLAATIIEGLMRHQVDLHQLVEQVLARDVTVRLASILLDLGDRFGLPMTEGFTKIGLPVPHQLLANMIGSNRVTVTRKLAEMRDSGMAGTLGRNIITIHPILLHDHIRAASFVQGNGVEP